MDVMVFIGLGAAAGVIVFLFLVTRLFRAVWGDDDSDFAPSRRHETRPQAKSAKPSSVAKPSVAGRSKGNAEPPAFTRTSSLVERVEALVSSDVREAQSDVSEAASDAPDAPEAPAQVSPPTISSTRSDAVKLSRHSKDEAATSEARADGGGGFTDYTQVGEQVTAVLMSAERAAADIREAANREAEDLRLAAEEELAEAKAEAERIRAEAEAYRDKTKGAADSYADETHRAADADAAKARAETEEKAQAVEAGARRKAKEIETAALRRRDELRQSATDLEERIGEMLGTFRAMTVDLEGLLPTDQKPSLAKAGEDGDAVADDTLEDALKPERVA